VVRRKKRLVLASGLKTLRQLNALHMILGGQRQLTELQKNWYRTTFIHVDLFVKGANVHGLLRWWLTDEYPLV